MCCAAGKSRERFYRDMALYAPDPVEARLKDLVSRRLAGEPVAYLIGEWEFYGLSLEITPDVLIPRLDTEVLAERAILLARAAGEGARVLDLCAGSGCVGLAVAANVPGCRVVLAEQSEGALAVCKRNVRRHELNARVTCVQADALADPEPALWDFDVIACNPPYIPTGDLAGLDVSVRDYEPRSALDGGGRRAGLLPFHRRPLALRPAAGGDPGLRGGHWPGPRRGADPDPERLCGHSDLSGHRRHLAGGGGDRGALEMRNLQGRISSARLHREIPEAR